jgi:hypothetical protein
MTGRMHMGQAFCIRDTLVGLCAVRQAPICIIVMLSRFDEDTLQ